MAPKPLRWFFPAGRGRSSSPRRGDKVDSIQRREGNPLFGGVAKLEDDETKRNPNHGAGLKHSDITDYKRKPEKKGGGGVKTHHVEKRKPKVSLGQKQDEIGDDEGSARGSETSEDVSAL